MSACQCQRSRVAVVHNGVRALSRGTFERTGDFGRGMFERTDDFGSFSWGALGMGLIQSGLSIGSAIAIEKLTAPRAASQASQPAQPQSAFTAAAAQTQQQDTAKAEAEKTKQTLIIVGGIAIAALLVVVLSRRK